jgi:hypothetical protein
MSAFTSGLAQGLFFGILLGILMALACVFWIARSKKADSAVAVRKMPKVPPAALLVVVIFGAAVVSLFGNVMVIYAQTPTMVPLQIPINPVMSSTNDWMATFAPIAAIGIGMTLALAVFAFLGKTIKSAFS